MMQEWPQELTDFRNAVFDAADRTPFPKAHDSIPQAIRDAYDRRVQRTQTTGDRNAGTGVGPNGSNPTGM